MSIFEFNQEEYGRTLYQEGIEQGIEKGIEKMVISLDKQGVQKEIIASAAKLSVPQVNDIILRNAAIA